MSDAQSVLAYLNSQVLTLPVDNSRSLQYYYNLAAELHRQSDFHETQSDVERQYVVLKRFVTLYVKTISAHNSFQLKAFATDKFQCKKQCDVALNRLSELKVLLLAKYDAAAAADGAEGDDAQADAATDAALAASEPTPALPAVVPAGVTTVVVTPSAATAAKPQGAELKYFHQTPKAAVAVATTPAATAQAVRWDNLRPAATPTATVVKQPLQFVPFLHTPATAATPANVKSASAQATAATTNGASAGATAGKPGNIAGSTTPTPTSKPPGATATATPKPKRKPPPLPKHLFESKRPLIVPASLMHDFATVATPNTTANVETCGILCGRIEHGKGGAGGGGGGERLVVSHCILPVQYGTSDTCVTAGEEGLIGVQDKFSLITLGWIHTHPSQTNFLSSIDQHTQFSYQIMIPEAVAIVLSPSFHPNTGCYSMTPRGLTVLSQCDRAGFHQHPINDGLYGPAVHTLYDAAARCVFVDLRNAAPPAAGPPATNPYAASTATAAAPAGAPKLPTKPAYCAGHAHGCGHAHGHSHSPLLAADAKREHYGHLHTPHDALTTDIVWADASVLPSAAPTAADADGESDAQALARMSTALAALSCA